MDDKEMITATEAQKEKTGKKKRVLVRGNIFVKAAALLVMLVTSLITVGCIFLTVMLYRQGGFYRSFSELLYENMSPIVYEDTEAIKGYLRGYYDTNAFRYHDTMSEMLDGYIKDKNIVGVAVRYLSNGGLVTYSGTWDENDFVYSIGQVWSSGGMVDINIYVDNTFPLEDDYYLIYHITDFLYNYRFEIILTGALAGLIAFSLLIFLFFAAGYHGKKEGIQPGILNRVYYDVLVVGVGGLWIGATAFLELFIRSYWKHNLERFSGCVLAGIVYLIITMLLAMVLLMELAVRIKLKQGIKQSLCCKIVGLIWKLIKRIGAFFWFIMKMIPMMPMVSACIFIVCLGEFLGLMLCHANDFALLMMYWFLEKLVLVPLIMVVAWQCNKLRQASREIAGGNLTYKVKTEKMLPAIWEHGENLNHIGEGLSAAVEEQMRSERLKTELITNVSHDLKTPLTSIINYAELLGTEELEPEKVTEYSEVLLRQSKRLKKLLEDLLEASKATTGNLEVHFEDCQIGVLLSQAAGEYVQRFETKNLKPVIRMPEDDVCIRADGRHMWRIFDNLLNNVVKYAQENTRVYLTLECVEKQAVVTFRNTSKYELDTAGEDLLERFVRGDKSRNMEGNGLGLSIAKSLVELQNGLMSIVTDGDLFKVVLQFPINE